jgi:hypothetical protein
MMPGLELADEVPTQVIQARQPEVKPEIRVVVASSEPIAPPLATDVRAQVAGVFDRCDRWITRGQRDTTISRWNYRKVPRSCRFVPRPAMAILVRSVL